MIGEVVAGRYRVLSRIGAGGGGEVYEAEDLELPRRVAIKFLSQVWTDERHLRQRFLREAEALSALDHPHICTIYQTGETDAGRMFIAMAYYQGQDLRARLAHGALDLVEAISWGISIADGMDKAHRKGFLHRDLKPGNIIITEDGVVKILDFGLAKLPDRTQMTETGTTMGTIAYAAPEQALGEKVDARSDIYSLGVLLYQMVTGICPFAANNAAATLQLVLGAEVKPAGKIRHDLPAHLDSLIARCMNRDRDERPSSMDEVRDELLDILASISPSEAALKRAQHVDTTSVPGLPRRRPLTDWIVIALIVIATTMLVRSESVRGLIGFGGPPENHGAMLLPFTIEGEDAHLSTLAAGLWADLNDQAMRIADQRAELWVLPASVAIDGDATTARERFGVEVLIEGTLSLDAEALRLDLSSVDADGDVTRTSWTIPAEDPVAPDPVPFLLDALDLSLSDDERSAVAHGSPADWQAWKSYLLGMGELSNEDPRGAVDHLAEAYQGDPRFMPARLRFAEAMIAYGTGAGGEVWLDHADSLLAAEARPLRFPATSYALLGRLQESRGELVDAARTTRLALDHRPQNPDLRRSLWLLWYYQGDLDAAEAVTLDGTGINPNYAGAWEDRGFVAYLRNDIEGAIDHFRRSLELAPGNANAWNTLGTCYLMLDDFAEATRAFQESFGIEGTAGSASNLGSLYYLQREFQLAADMYEFAQHYNPDDYRIIGNRASALRFIPGREAESDSMLVQAVRLAETTLAEDPDDTTTLTYLASYCATLDPGRGIELAEQALIAEPENPELLFRVAVVFEETGHRARALSILESAIAHGQAMSQITREPLLDDLRDDPRYLLLLP